MSKNSVHVYRALLRECTYLPDPNSRAYIKTWAQGSFRRYLPQDSARPQCKPVAVTPERETTVLRKARHLVYTLRRANEGYPTSFEKVLRWTYARTGRRRRSLMTNLTNQEPNRSELEEPGNEQPKKFGTGWQAPPTVRALLQHQNQHQSQLPWQRGKLKSRGPAIAATNLWGKPMPECRIRNKQQEWYAKHLNMLLLPLPEEEYMQIKAYATGESKLQPKQRRPAASVLTHSSLESSEGCKSVVAEPGMSERVKERPHYLTQRFIRRHMQRLLMHVPYAQAPVDKPDMALAVKWDRAYKGKWKVDEANGEQANALFG